MEGLLCLPPERNILGRGGWKTRYVKLGPNIQQSAFSSTWSFSQTSITSGGSTTTIGRSDGGQPTGGRDRSATAAQPTSQPMPSAPPTATGPPPIPGESTHVLSIYKQRFDNDPLITFPLDAIASCFLGDVAQRKGFGSISKSMINALQPTLVVNIKPEFTVKNNRRKSHVERLNPAYNGEGEAVSKLHFRAGPRDSPSLSAWAKAIQALLPGGFDETTAQPSGSRGSTSIGSVTEAENEDKTSPIQHHGSFDSYSTNSDSGQPPELRRMTYRAGSPHPSVTPSLDFEPRRSATATNYRAVSPHPSITASSDHESLSSYQLAKTISPDTDTFDACSAVSTDFHATSSATSSLSRRETILDRAFNMNYIPSTPSPSASPPPNSVARFEALIQEREAAAAAAAGDGQYAYTPDRSVMPASFFDDFVPSLHTPTQTQDDSVPVLRSPSGMNRDYSNRRHTQRPGMIISLDEMREALKEVDED